MIIVLIWNDFLCVFVVGSKDNAFSDGKKCRGRCRNVKAIDWDAAEVACFVGLTERCRRETRNATFIFSISQ